MFGKERNRISTLLDVVYDETSPSGLRWAKRKRGRKPNSSAGYLDKDGYWIITFARKHFRVHHLILKIHNVDLKVGDYVDHINGDRGNNNLYNLRVVDFNTNMRNMKMNSLNTSGVVGVVYDKWGDRWVASWRDMTTKKTITQKFPVVKFGERAFQLAVAAREAAIRDMNERGAGYSERHGTKDV